MGRIGIGILATLLILALSGCNSGHRMDSRSKQANEPSQLPVVYGTQSTSPDGKRMAVVTHDASRLEVGPAAGHGPWQTLYVSPYTLTTDLYWATPNLIAFGDSNVEANTIDVRTRRVHLRLATATSFNVSSDGRWVAWSRVDGPEAPDRVGIVSITGRECLLVPRPRNRSDSLAFFKPGVKRLFFLRTPYDPQRGVVGSGRSISLLMSSLRRAPTSACQR
jgi:hypothetical protein